MLAAEHWIDRDQALGEAYAVLAARHNALGLTEPLPAQPERFDRYPGDLRARQQASVHDRPFSVIRGERFAEALAAGIRDPVVRAAPRWLGGIDQWSDSTLLLGEGESPRPRLCAVFGRGCGTTPGRRRGGGRDEPSVGLDGYKSQIIISFAL